MAFGHIRENPVREWRHDDLSFSKKNWVIRRGNGKRGHRVHLLRKRVKEGEKGRVAIELYKGKRQSCSRVSAGW